MYERLFSKGFNIYLLFSYNKAVPICILTSYVNCLFYFIVNDTEFGYVGKEILNFEGVNLITLKMCIFFSVE